MNQSFYINGQTVTVDVPQCDTCGCIRDYYRDVESGQTVLCCAECEAVLYRFPDNRPRVYFLMDIGATLDYLGFGSQALEEVAGLRLCSALVEHATWQTMRLQSGMALRGFSNTYPSIEAARLDAVKFSNALKGVWE